MSAKILSTMLASLSFFKARADFRRCPAFPEFLLEIDVASYRRLRRDLLFLGIKSACLGRSQIAQIRPLAMRVEAVKLQICHDAGSASALSCAIDRKHKLIHINFLLRH